MAGQGGDGITVTRRGWVGMEEPDRSLGQKVPDQEEGTLNIQGERSAKLINMRVGILPYLQSRRGGGRVVWYLHK